ncbi:tRNA-specific 2-thiouridylase MnmA [Buchnera aphidicola (Myzocallis carpini)]|uniref:tRNA 2-thiouridine(34) synthase MnmA n=1 Tax=Buchnera aphidicola TaxID=9 RepID=UPI003A6EA7F8
MNIKKKVIVAMSGGVDSSVSAYLLLKQGYIVEGMFMKNWEEDDKNNFCSSSQDLSDTRLVCKKLGIILHEVNFSEEYWNLVFEKFLLEHRKGKTPNPDILCNEKIKFGIFFNVAQKIFKADYIATGHYAQVKYFNKQPMLLRGLDSNKDQSYFLHRMTLNKLRKILFPVGHLKKKTVRKIAQKINLPNANKKDSVGICFIGSCKMKNFLSRFIKIKKGNIVNSDGYILGIHHGLVNYTIGQRKGIGIGGISGKKKFPWYVIEKNLFKNTLVVCQGNKNIKLLSIGLIAIDVHWISMMNISNILYCTIKTRYQQKDISGKIILISLNSVKIFFNTPITSITPGQSVVFYMLDICLGGGFIKQPIFLSKDTYYT